MSDDDDLVITAKMMKALTHPLPNFHKTYEEYLHSEFRSQYLRAWAQQRAVPASTPDLQTKSE
jgi:hypothetical protein